MANPINAYLISNVLQDADELRKRGALSQPAYAALTAPLQPHTALVDPYLSAPGGHPAPLGADSPMVVAGAPVAAPSAPHLSPAPSLPGPAVPGPSSPAASAAPAAPPSPPADDGGRPSVAALTARLGGLNTSRTPPGSSAVRTSTGVPKRAPPPAPTKGGEEKGERAKAKWDYKATAEDELGFARGDVIAVVERTTEDWWKGHLVGAMGNKAEDRLFPSNYVELIKTKPAVPRRFSAEKEKDPPPSYGASTTPSHSYTPTYGAASPATGNGAPAHAPGYGNYGAPPPASYGAYPPAQADYPRAQPAPFVAPAAAGLQPEPEDQRKARKEKMSKALDSNVGRAAVGGLAFGTAASVVGAIL